jgi:hypothetical protein
MLVAGAFLLLNGSCSAATSRATLRLAVGQTREQITQQSELAGIDISGLFFALITTPHAIEYKDTRLWLTLPECGQRISMPTTLSYDDVGRLDRVTASVLGEYVDVFVAAKRARALTDEFRSQGFEYESITHGRANKYARLAVLRSEPNREGIVPSVLDSEGDIEKLYLNPDYCISEMIVFQLRSGRVSADLRMTNMRRKFSRGEPVRAVEDRLSDADRRTEKSYYLEISISEQDA